MIKISSKYKIISPLVENYDLTDLDHQQPIILMLSHLAGQFFIDFFYIFQLNQWPFFSAELGYLLHRVLGGDGQAHNITQDEVDLEQADNEEEPMVPSVKVDDLGVEIGDEDQEPNV